MDKMIEHLRLIGLTLLTISFLILVGTFTVTSKVDIAYQEFCELRDILENWNNNFLEEFSVREFGLTTADMSNIPTCWLIHPEEKLNRRKLSVRLNPPFTCMLPQPEALKRFDKRPLYRTQSIKIEKPSNITLFELVQFWNSLDTSAYLSIINYIEPNAKVYKSVPFKRSILLGSNSLCKIDTFIPDMQEKMDVNAYIEAIDSMLLVSDIKHFSEVPFTHVFVGECPSDTPGVNWVVMIPARSNRVTFNVLRALIKVHGRNLPQNRFEQTFPALYEATKAYQNIASLEITGEILKSEMVRERPPIEVFGAKLPNTAIGVWGVTILVLMQVYFVCHLKELAIEFAKSGCIGTPWLPFLRNRLSKIISILSFTVIPCGVIISITILGFLRYDHYVTTIYRVVLVFMSLYYSTMTYSLFMSMWKKPFTYKSST